MIRVAALFLVIGCAAERAPAPASAETAWPEHLRELAPLASLRGDCTLHVAQLDPEGARQCVVCHLNRDALAADHVPWSNNCIGCHLQLPD